MQGLLGGIRDKQRKLQEAHERTKTVTRTGEMKEIRERMQARPSITVLGALLLQRDIE